MPIPFNILAKILFYKLSFFPCGASWNNNISQVLKGDPKITVTKNGITCDMTLKQKQRAWSLAKRRKRFPNFVRTILEKEKEINCSRLKFRRKLVQEVTLLTPKQVGNWISYYLKEK